MQEPQEIAMIMLQQEFSEEAFVHMPKCRGRFFYKESKGTQPAGCLLSAFWYALGFTLMPITETYENPRTGTLHTVSMMLSATNIIAKALVPEKCKMPHWAGESCTEDNCEEHGYDFCSQIVDSYDAGEDKEALDLVFSLIDALPRRNKYRIEDRKETLCFV